MFSNTHTLHRQSSYNAVLFDNIKSGYKKQTTQSYGIYTFSRVVVALLVTVRHSQLAKVVTHGRDAAGVTLLRNVYLVQHIKHTLGNVNLGFITIALPLDEILLVPIISK